MRLHAASSASNSAHLFAGGARAAAGIQRELAPAVAAHRLHGDVRVGEHELQIFLRDGDAARDAREHAALAMVGRVFVPRPEAREADGPRIRIRQRRSSRGLEPSSHRFGCHVRRHARDGSEHDVFVVRAKVDRQFIGRWFAARRKDEQQTQRREAHSHPLLLLDCGDRIEA
jgi:hypothetical protein